MIRPVCSTTPITLSPWCAVPVDHSTYVKALTGGRLEGTLHRAAGHGGDRCSVGFFPEPDFETAVVAPAGGPPVSCARHLVNELPDRFEAPRAA